MIKMTMFVLTDNTSQNDNQMLTVVCINISTTVVFIVFSGFHCFI